MTVTLNAASQCEKGSFMIRWLAAQDAAPLLSVIQYRAVREGPSLYTETQRVAWIPRAHPPEKLAERLGATLDPTAAKPKDDDTLVYRHPGPEARA